MQLRLRADHQTGIGNLMSTSQSEVDRVSERLAEWRVEAKQLQASFELTKNSRLLVKRIRLCEKIALAEEWLAGQRVKNKVLTN